MEYYDYKFKKRPPYLEGCFDWKSRGYGFVGSPELPLLTGDALYSDDPWVRLASAVEFAKTGNRSHVGKVADLVDERVAPTLLGGTLDFIADAGSRSELEILARLMLDGTPYIRLEAVNSARWAGVLWLLPYMANVLEDVSRRADREAIESAISTLLDPLDGDNLAFFDTSDSPRAYAERVARRVHELAGQAGTDNAAVFAGELIDMQKLILRMQQRLREPASDNWSDFSLLRHKFEAYTGTDCSKFYRDGSFRPLSARVAIDSFVEANPSLQFKVGQRYFFMKEIA